MTNKTRDQDIWNEEQKSRATHYTATIFYKKRYTTVECETLDQAIDVGHKFNSIVDNGRKSTVYAVTPDGFTIWVCNPHQLTV